MLARPSSTASKTAPTLTAHKDLRATAATNRRDKWEYQARKVEKVKPIWTSLKPFVQMLNDIDVRKHEESELLFIYDTCDFLIEQVEETPRTGEPAQLPEAKAKGKRERRSKQQILNETVKNLLLRCGRMKKTFERIYRLVEPKGDKPTYLKVDAELTMGIEELSIALSEFSDWLELRKEHNQKAIAALASFRTDAKRSRDEGDDEEEEDKSYLTQEMAAILRSQTKEN
jgi:hypothetical protein